MDERLMNTWVGFGVDLPAGASIQTAWGTLRARQDQDVALLRRHHAEHDPQRGSILEPPAHDAWMTQRDGQRVLRCKGIDDPAWKRVALALVLAQDPAKALPTLPWFCVESLDGGGGASEFRQFRKGGDVTTEQLPEVARWLDLVNHPRLPDIAVDRATLMVHRITNHIEALVDGVIVWECLFGAGVNQELSFRVSVNMACVLSDDPATRVAYQTEIKNLYDLRSSIVHGAKAPKSGDDHDHRLRVQELTLSAIRALLQNHPTLVGAKSPAFMAFILGSRAGTAGDQGGRAVEP